MDKINYDANVYTDIQGLKQLEYSKNKDLVKKEVAKQFESIFMQLVLHSMRNANSAFGSNLFGSNQMEMYQSMFDNQLSLMLSHSGLGFAKMVENSIDQSTAQPTVSAPAIDSNKQSENVESHQGTVIKSALASVHTLFHSAEDFVKHLLPIAKSAATTLGVKPEVLIAQAALETSWGRKIIKKDGVSSFNLFNIKSNPDWKNKSIEINALEENDGVLKKEKATFRCYDSFKESFSDYIQYIKKNSRYQEALANVNDPLKYIKAIQDAGYATDKNYAAKVEKILNSHVFKKILAKFS